MGICLNMIVKNESKNLVRLFNSIHSCIDYFIISDTGSSDDTIELIYALGRQYNISGKVVKHDWQDFAHNRQFALELAVDARLKGEHDCNWLLIIDADEELIVADKDWANKLEPGVSYTTYKNLGGLTYKHLFLVWIEGQKWNWIGKVHNYLVNENKTFLKKHISDVFIKAYQSEGSNTARFRDNSEKGFYYLNELLNELGSSEISSQNSTRFFQLAYTYRDINDMESAIAIMDRLVKSDNVSPGLKYISLVFMAKFQIRLNHESPLIEQHLHQAMELLPERKEAYYYLAMLNKFKKKPKESREFLEKANVLTVQEGAYNIIEDDVSLWKIKYELAFICFQLQDKISALKYIDELIKTEYVPDVERNFLISLKEKIVLTINTD
jgi:glycosyltransferase involved in cell wall biosynthesis